MNSHQRYCMYLILFIWIIFTTALVANLFYAAGMDVMSNAILGLLLNIIAGFIVAWLFIRYEILFQLKTELIKLRNVLYDVEWEISLQHFLGKPMAYQPGMIRTTGLEDADWREWKSDIKSISENLFQMKRRLLIHGKLFGKGVWAKIFAVSSKIPSVHEHFEKIDSVFISIRPTDYLGIIECTTDAGNLLRRAWSANNSLNKHAKSYRDWLENPQNGSCTDMKYDEDKLENIRLKIKLHREYIEEIIKHLPDGIELIKVVCSTFHHDGYAGHTERIPNESK